MSPTPSTWAIGVAAPSGIDPYQALEGSPKFGIAGGEVPVKPEQMRGGHVSEVLDWKNSPAVWVLVALLAIGVLHINFKGGTNVGVSA